MPSMRLLAQQLPWQRALPALCAHVSLVGGVALMQKNAHEDARKFRNAEVPRRQGSRGATQYLALFRARQLCDSRPVAM